MTRPQSLRLSRIRADSQKWIRKMPEARNWDNAFLLSIIDKMGRRIQQLEKKRLWWS